MYLKYTNKGLKIELTGKQISCWTVTNGISGYKNETLWRCVCVCGTVAFYSGKELIYDKNRPASCGCTPDAPRFYLPDSPEVEARKQRKAKRRKAEEQRRREAGIKTKITIILSYDTKDRLKEWCKKRKTSMEGFLLEYIEDILAGRRHASVPQRKTTNRKNWLPRNPPIVQEE